MSAFEQMQEMLQGVNQKYRILDLYPRGSGDDSLPTAYRLVIDYVGRKQTDTYIFDFDSKTGKLISIG